MHRRLSEIVFSLGVLAFLFAGLLGVHHMNMAMDADGSMDNCPFALDGVICTMTPFEHIRIVRSLLTALSQQRDALGYLAFIVLATSLFVVVVMRVFVPPKLLYAHNYAFIRENVPSGDFLQEAFSGGLLHTKVF